MANTVPRMGCTTPTITPAEAEAARLLLLAHNSLTQALRSIRRTDTSPEALRAATGRAARAATMMRRLCELTAGGAA